jgi:hypothetical protein
MNPQNDPKDMKLAAYLQTHKFKRNDDGSHCLSSITPITASAHHAKRCCQVKTIQISATINGKQRRKLVRLAEKERKMKAIQSQMKLIPFERHKSKICKRKTKKISIDASSRHIITLVSNSF